MSDKITTIEELKEKHAKKLFASFKEAYWSAPIESHLEDVLLNSLEFLIVIKTLVDKYEPEALAKDYTMAIYEPEQKLSEWLDENLGPVLFMLDKYGLDLNRANEIFQHFIDAKDKK